MLCCPECFDDRTIRIEWEHSGNTGCCYFCGATDQNLIHPEALKSKFEILSDAYFPDDSGKLLVEWFKSDWGLFSNPRMDIANASRLLAEILDDGDIVRRRFAPIKSLTSFSSVQGWYQLKEELKHTNRFFLSSQFDFNTIKKLISLLEIEVDNLSRDWFRSRIQIDTAPFPPEQMLAPPAKLASHGRANPAGIPYLYIASDEETAASELRPHTGDLMTIAKLSIPSQLKLVDLRDPRKTISPFELEDISELRNAVEVLVKLGEELTRPVLRHSAAYDYVPSQFLCEFIKNCGFDGVCYRSSVGNGFNVALFKPDCAAVTQLSSFVTHRVVVEMTAVH
ncbi:RES family NAD+ phosphorylase [Rheinheimera lutimaris]|nr:RES family NAD+ phosphorylase [Rheinheimera lutimaris]